VQRTVSAQEEAPRRAVTRSTIAALCLLWGLFGLWANNLLDERRHTMEQVLDRQRAAVEEQVHGIFAIIETFLAVANHWVAAHPDLDPRSEPEFAALVHDFQQVNNKSLTFRLADSDGTLHLVPEVENAKPANIADRDYFIAAMNNPPGQLSVSSPYVGRATSHHAVSVATRLTKPSHGLSVVYIAIELDMLEEVFAKARSHQDGVITLIRKDGIILARSASEKIEVGRSVADGPVFRQGLSQSDHGVLFTPSSITDHIPRLVAFGALDRYPLVVAVGAGYDDIMAEPKAAIMRVAVILLLVSLLLLLARWKIISGLDALTASRAQLLASHDHLAAEVDERRQIETALQRSESDLRAILDNMTDMFYRTDNQGRLSMVSRSVKTLLGYEPDEVLGQNAAMLHYEADGRAKLLETLEQSGSVADYPFRARHKLGHGVWVAASAHRLPGPKGAVSAIEGVCRDISQSRAQLEEIQRSNAELEQFAYVASHDLREPLRMIASYLGLLERRCGDALSEDGKEFLNFARDGAKRMDRLVLDLLDYSRIGRRGEAVAPMPLKPAIDQCLRHLAMTIEDGKASVMVDDSLAEARIIGDQDQIMRLFQNLIGNGLKYHAEGRNAEITISGRQVEGNWELCVSDNGIGIDPAYSERIFGLFQRLHTQQSIEGTGIGLAVCKKIVERHGGTIWVESQPGQGCRFFFTLPSVF